MSRSTDSPSSRAGRSPRSIGTAPVPVGIRMRSAPSANPPSFRAHEFAPSRWKDFETLFRKYHGVQAGCWCMFYHREGPMGPLEDTTRPESNRRDHHALLLAGHAHGILVYRDGAPVGWCQYGLREELPRIERGRKYRAFANDLGPPPRWRITCFFVDRPYRRAGAARFALHAALESIRRRGGGIVEAYPATHGRAVATWFGTQRMFESEGFRVIRPFGQSNVLVRREIPGPGGSRGGNPRRSVRRSPRRSSSSRDVA